MSRWAMHRSLLAVSLAIALVSPTVPVAAQESAPTLCTRIQWMAEEPEAAVRLGLSELPSMMAVLGMTRLWAAEHERYEAAFLARAQELIAAAILALQPGAPPIGENAFGIPPHLPRSLSDILLEEFEEGRALLTAANVETGPATDAALATALRACGL